MNPGWMVACIASQPGDSGEVYAFRVGNRDTPFWTSTFWSIRIPTSVFLQALASELGGSSLRIARFPASPLGHDPVRAALSAAVR
jgi:hypothetical protein